MNTQFYWIEEFLQPNVRSKWIENRQQCVLGKILNKCWQCSYESKFYPRNNMNYRRSWSNVGCVVIDSSFLQDYAEQWWKKREKWRRKGVVLERKKMFMWILVGWMCITCFVLVWWIRHINCRISDFILLVTKLKLTSYLLTTPNSNL